MPEGFLEYFTSRYPRLLVYVHEVVKETGLHSESMFKNYFELPESWSWLFTFYCFSILCFALLFFFFLLAPRFRRAIRVLEQSLTYLSFLHILYPVSLPFSSPLEVYTSFTPIICNILLLHATMLQPYIPTHYKFILHTRHSPQTISLLYNFIFFPRFHSGNTTRNDQ